MRISVKAAAAGVCVAATLYSNIQTVQAGDTTTTSWTGFYVGGFLGGGAVNNDVDLLSGLLAVDGISGEGVVGGGFLGFNYQVTPNFVLGLQGELGVQNLKTESSLSPVVLGGFEVEAAPEFNAAISGRLGWLVNPDAMFYIIGGYSYAKYETEVSVPLAAFNASFNENYHGLHIGAGLEARLTDSLSARIEYRFTQYDAEDWGTGGIVEVEPSTHVGTVGLAWNFNPLGDTVISPVADLMTHETSSEDKSWSGLYVGGFLGGGGISNEIDVFGGLFEFNGIGGEGLVGGVFAGLNHQIASSFVVGLQGEIGVANLETEISVPLLLNVEAAPELNAALSLRAGWLANPDTLLYLMGGYSYAKYETEITIPIAALSASFDETFHGFHIGAGLEARLTDSLSARIEYRYTQYGEEDWGTGGLVEVAPSSHVGTVGLAWNFNGLW